MVGVQEHRNPLRPRADILLPIYNSSQALQQFMGDAEMEENYLGIEQ